MRMQKLALKKSPYSPPLLRQLKLIEDALEQSEAEASIHPHLSFQFASTILTHLFALEIVQLT